MTNKHVPELNIDFWGFFPEHFKLNQVLNHEITKSLNHKIIKSRNHEITKSRNHEITKSWYHKLWNHEIIISRNYEIKTVYRHSLVAYIAHYTLIQDDFINAIIQQMKGSILSNIIKDGVCYTTSAQIFILSYFHIWHHHHL